MSTTKREHLLPRSPLASRPQGTQWKMYIEKLYFNSIKLNLSYILVEGEHEIQPMGVRSRHGAPQLMDVLMDHTSTISNAPIQLNTLDIDHIFNTPEHIAGVLQEHYVRQFLYQIYNIVLGFDFMGNPISLINSLSTGVTEFFQAPVKGFVESPSARGLGLVKGFAHDLLL